MLAVLAGLGREWAALLGRPLTGLRGLVLLLWPAIACVAALVTGHWAEAGRDAGRTPGAGPGRRRRQRGSWGSPGSR